MLTPVNGKRVATPRLASNGYTNHSTIIGNGTGLSPVECFWALSGSSSWRSFPGPPWGQPSSPSRTPSQGPGPVPPDKEVTADGETEPVANATDAADDMAFWVHPTDRASSVIITTDKLGAIETFDLSGRRLQTIDLNSRPDNVDVRYGFSLGGRSVDVIGVGGYGMRSYTIDPATRLLTNVTAADVKPGIPVAGTCMYKSYGAEPDAPTT